MSLFKRGLDIARANLNDLLGKAEDPEKMMNLWLNDAKAGLQESRVALHDAIEAEKLLQGQWDEAMRDQKLWAERQELAARKQNAELTTQAVSERHSTEARLESLKGPLADAQAQSKVMRSQVDVLERKIVEADRNRMSLIARAKAAQGKKRASDAISRVQSSDPTSVVSSMEDKIRHMEAAASASDELTHSHRGDLEDQFKSLETSGGQSVDDEVAALLAKNKPAVSTPVQ